MPNVLVDTGVWLAFCDPRDTTADKATVDALYARVQPHSLIIPWPITYETLRSRFVKNKLAMERFEKELKSPKTNFIDVSPYRDEALQLTFNSSLRRNRPLSMVDCMMRLMMDDRKIKIDYLATFNGRDFSDVCKSRRIELWPIGATEAA